MSLPVGTTEKLPEPTNWTRILTGSNASTERSCALYHKPPWYSARQGISLKRKKTPQNTPTYTHSAAQTNWTWKSILLCDRDKVFSSFSHSWYCSVLCILQFSLNSSSQSSACNFSQVPLPHVAMTRINRKRFGKDSDQNCLTLKLFNCHSFQHFSWVNWLICKRTDDSLEDARQMLRKISTRILGVGRTKYRQ